MNKVISTSFIILCLLSILFLTECKTSVKASQNIIHVPYDQPTIQEAVNKATDGDTIFVHNGTYKENIDVNKSVSLVGEYRDFTIVDGDGADSVISITANNVTVTSFTVTNSGVDPTHSGIRVEYSSGNIISHNRITNNTDGISLYSSGKNLISGNTISSNNFDGISLYSSRNNLISGNTISSNNFDGISLYSSGKNLISGNTISSNNLYGISLYFSSNNTIYCNNFNNTNQVWSDSVNVWNCTNEGNYWSGYRGQDLNGDGIGDYPYVIDDANQDNQPLMGMFSDLTVTLKRETYHVAVICNSTISDFRFEIGGETGNKIVRFNVTGEVDTAGFCRVIIPTELMDYPFVVLVGGKEIIPISLDISNETHVYLYFTYMHSSHTITIISSKTLHLYNELIGEYVKLQIDLSNLNATYYDLLYNLSILLSNYTQLQESYRGLNDSYQDHLLEYTKSVDNLRNLMYIFAATTAVFMVTTVYLSKRAHADIRTKTKVSEDEK